LQTGLQRLRFNACFWLPFCLGPLFVQGLEQWPEVSIGQCLDWLRQAIVFTVGMSALAELFGSYRRFFYLVAGVILGGGAILSILFVATTGITENAYTALTGIVYSGRDGAGLRYLVIQWQDLPGLITALVPFVLLARCWRKLSFPSSWPWFACATAVCTVITVSRWMWHDYGSVHPFGAVRLDTLGSILDPPAPIAAYVTLRRTLPLAREMMLQPDRPAPVARVDQDSRPLTLVVVVGESTTREHMGVYGYCRNTTPSLTALQAELFEFRNVVSEIPLTVFALSNAFRVSMDRSQGQPDQSIFDVFNAAGLHTYWLSNQFDYPGDPVSSLTARAQHRVSTYRGKKNEEQHHNTFDESLLTPLDQVLLNDSHPKVVLMHTVGTHSDYDDRVPTSFEPAYFRSSPLNRSADAKQTIDAYDRAVRYADWLLGQVISRARNTTQDIAVVYFSDHGDEVFDRINFVGHRYPRATEGMVEVPLLVWLSPALRRNRPDLLRALDAAAALPMDLRDLAPLLLDIADVNVQGLSATRRPLSGQFQSQRRRVADEDYDQDHTLGVRPVLTPLACR
jgi:glucan phosphoethanolaminetransferase (alkaline phosphatase superfamily)